MNGAVLPPATAKWRQLERRIEAAFAAAGFAEARPPLDEGDAPRHDVLGSLARLVATPGPAPLRLWSAVEVYDPRPLGPLRSSSWHAHAAVCAGLPPPLVDVELACLVGMLAADVGLRAPELRLGCGGTPDELAAYRAMVAATIKAAPRCETCKMSDLLRVLVCDEEPCRALARELPPVRSCLGAASTVAHDEVVARVRELDVLGPTALADDEWLALPDATGTVFVASALDGDGVRRVVAIGGRRDDLVRQNGGPATPLVGLSLGLARWVACAPADGVDFRAACELYLVSHGDAARLWALRTALVERARGFRVEVDLREASWSAQLERAKSMKARVVVLAGQAGREPGELTIRAGVAGEPRTIRAAQLPSELKKLLR